ncbi:MAG: GNAT family N-acetyltransferase [Candidatus Pacearchaeota archaeon]|jgi:ribosomal-protein-alanine N-acetyltransferase
MKLKTQRLLLREIDDKDLSELVRNANNLNVSRYLEKMPYPYTEENGKGFIKHCLVGFKKDQKEDYEFVIEFQGKFIGMISLMRVDQFQETCTMGYWIGEDYWRKGIVFEAASEIIRFGFEDLKLRRINIEAYTENIASNELIKKLGFNYEGARKQYKKTRSTGDIYDCNIYGLLKDSYKEKE